ncbi:MAG: site-2 protease family protein [Gaiellaceae bacterium]
MSRLTDDPREGGREESRDEDWLPARRDAFSSRTATDGEDWQLRDYEPIQPRGRDWRRLARTLAAPFIALALLVWKLKALVFVVFKFKIFTTAATMLVSIAAYALLWPWQFAVGLVLLLLVHELGHVLEARRQGLPTSAPMFIPFMGALITMKQLPENAWREAQVALAGPIVGSLGAAACWALGAALDSDLLVALAFVGFLLNLFNLLPIVPLDGGRAVAALHPAVWLLGFAALVVLLFISPNPILILVLIIGGMELLNRWQARKSPEAKAYYRVTAGQRVAVAVVYVGLAVALGVAADLSHLEKDV